MFWFAIVLTIVSNVFYHIFQKITPQEANPVLALAVSYLAAGLVCLGLLVFFPLEEGVRQSVKQLNWATIGLAFTLVGLELGFLLAYRAGWDISLAGLASNATVSVLLLPVGLLAFKEQLSRTNMIGVLVTIAGLLLMNWKK
ncbi:MAG: EamA family transporter [Anaerolineales bacterium]|nr:EamA family transporter [Anaerolineales bacterium]